MYDWCVLSSVSCLGYKSGLDFPVIHMDILSYVNAQLVDKTGVTVRQREPSVTVTFASLPGSILKVSLSLTPSVVLVLS